MKPPNEQEVKRENARSFHMPGKPGMSQDDELLKFIVVLTRCKASLMLGLTDTVEFRAQLYLN